MVEAEGIQSADVTSAAEVFTQEKRGFWDSVLSFFRGFRSLDARQWRKIALSLVGFAGVTIGFTFVSNLILARVHLPLDRFAVLSYLIVFLTFLVVNLSLFSPLPLLDDLVKETFWGKQCMGGDDKRLTYLVEAAGGKCRYQHSARVYTHAAENMATLFKQRTRWSRNSWRADLRALSQGWVFRHPFFTFILLDRIISNFTLLLSPIYFIFSLVFGLWLPAAALFLWWLFSRSLRIMPNLVRHPANIRLAPVYVWVNFVMAVIRTYGLLTLNRQDWITRTTEKKSGNAGLFLAWVGTFGILALMSLAVYASRF